MRVDAFLAKLRPMIFDSGGVGYSDSELIDYINAGILAHCNDCIRNGHASFLLKEVRFQYGDTAPDDVLAWAGQFPMEIHNGQVVPYDGSVVAKYYAHPGSVASTDDEIPIPNTHIPRLLSVVTALALNRNEYDISQDAAIANRMLGPKGG